MEITTAAAEALINCGTNRQGTPVQANGWVTDELRAAGLVGPNAGLTRKGTVYRERLVDETLDKAFGA